ncbi:MAG: hypothetical protein QXJ51_02890 [Sulfolobales archaeon]
MSEVSALNNIKALVSDFLVRYGERGRAVLEASIRAYNKNLSRYKDSSFSLPGDFDYKTLVEELGLMGYSYNPSPILRILEREYGLIRTTMHTSRQRWFSFSSEEVKNILEDLLIKPREGFSESDPELLIIRAQLISLRTDKIKRFLEHLLTKDVWSDLDYKKLRKISVEDLPQLLKIYERLKRRDSEKTTSIASEIEEIFRLLSKVVMQVYKRGDINEDRDSELEELQRDLERFTNEKI